MVQKAAAAAVRIKGLAFAYGPESPVFQGAEARARSGEITVLLGPEGGGKSTLLRLLAGELLPSAGRIVVPNSVARSAGEGAEAYLLDEPDEDLDPSVRDAFWQRLDELTSAGAAVLIASHDYGALEQRAHRVWIVDEGRIREAGSPEKAIRRHGRPLIATATPSPATSARLRIAALKLGLEPLGGPRGRWLFDVKDPEVAGLVPALAEACPEAEPTLIPSGLEAVALRVGARSHGRKSR